jgi:hypothetical protein
MLFSEPFVQERIANRTRERNVDDPTAMHMTDFRVSKAELMNLFLQMKEMRKLLEQADDFVQEMKRELPPK